MLGRAWPMAGASGHQVCSPHDTHPGCHSALCLNYFPYHWRHPLQPGETWLRRTKGCKAGRDKPAVFSDFSWRFPHLVSRDEGPAECRMTHVRVVSCCTQHSWCMVSAVAIWAGGGRVCRACPQPRAVRAAAASGPLSTR